MVDRTIKIAAAVILVLLVIILLSNIGHSRKMESLLRRQEKTNNIIEQRRLDDSSQVTYADANYVTREDLRKGNTALLDTLRRELVGPIRTLERTTRIIATRIEQLAIPVRDTTRILPSGTAQHGYVFNYQKPPFLRKMSGFLFGDSIHIDYEIESRYLLEHHWKRTGLFKPKELELIITSQDPNVSINKVQNFQVIAPVPIWQRPGVVGAGSFLSGLLIGLTVKP